MKLGYKCVPLSIALKEAANRRKNNAQLEQPSGRCNVLESFGELFGECAGWTLRTSLTARTLVLPAAAFTPGTGRSGRSSIHGTAGTDARTFGFGRLGLICPQQSIFQRSAIEAADDRVHLFRVRRIDEGESLRFLRLWVANYFYVVVYKVFCVEPGLDIVLGNPDRQISEENSEAHSGASLLRFRGFGKTASRLRIVKLTYRITRSRDW